MHLDVFVDTNGFIHFKDLKDRPWLKLFPGVKSVDLIVASSVIRELDHHKTSTNDRRRNRARLALTDIERASENPELVLTLKEQPVLVRLVISTVGIEWSATPTLDSAKPDDQLVAEAKSYSESAVVLSNDTGPRIRARIIGLQAVTPPEDWMLPADRTDDQRRIAKLEAELEAARSTRPKVEAYFEGFPDGDAAFEFEVPTLRPFDEDEVRALVQQFTSRSRMLLPRQGTPMSALDYVSRLGGAHISEASYERYEKEVKKYFANLHKTAASFLRGRSLTYEIENQSSVTATGLRIELSVEGAYLGRRSGFLDLGTTLEPPKEPSPAFALDTPILHSSFVPKERDPTGFYWIDGPEENDWKWGVLQCLEFRATQKDSLSARIFVSTDLPASGKVNVGISAFNLPKPVPISAMFSLKSVEGNWSDEAVREALPERVRNCLDGLQIGS